MMNTEALGMVGLGWETEGNYQGMLGCGENLRSAESKPGFPHDHLHTLDSLE